MKVGIVGAGGVGGYFGARLAQAGNDVCVVARGAHLAAIREGGLRIRSPKGDAVVAVAATEEPGSVGACDVVLVCVKSYDTASVAASIGPMLAGDSAIVSLQNGVDNEDLIAAQVGAERVLGGAAFIFSSIVAPGVVEHTGGPARLVFGELDGTRSARAERLLDHLRAAKIDAELTSEIRRVLWTKFAFICAAAGMTATSRLTLREVYNCDESREMFVRIVDEVVALACLEGIPLGDDVRDDALRFAATVDSGSYSSLYHDLVAGRPLELDSLHGAVVRRAAARGLPTPACQSVDAILRPSTAGRRAARS